VSRRSANSFDAVAETYDVWYATPLGQVTDELESAAVFARVAGLPGFAVDLSCGTGHYALELARRGGRVA
jgi:ubiquinone/menaquinone biosynthesis C-methylase UbiE